VSAASSQLDAARKIIAHRTTRGTIAENAVRAIIAPLLPPRFGVASGFLLTTAAQASQQIDVLVFDRLDASPVYEDQGFVVVSPEMAVLAMEVKSAMNKKDLQEAARNLASTKRLNPSAATVLFAFTGLKADTLATHLSVIGKSLPSRERIDVIINLRHDYVAELDRASRSSYNCYRDKGIAVKTLLLQTITSAKVRNLQDYIDVSPTLRDPFLRINL
jgi:hypothetical protein